MNWARFLLIGCAVVLAAVVLESTLRPAGEPAHERGRAVKPPLVAVAPAQSTEPRTPAPFIGQSSARPPSVSIGGGQPAGELPTSAIPTTPAGTRPAFPGGKKQVAAPTAGAKPPKERPIARDALALVGADPVAEAVWVDAINDPERSAHERSDLIEDLNEEGFPDPRHVTVDDLPLIERRLALIEQLAPDSMDNVNFEAFAEAYKDLVNMYVRLAGP